MLQHDICLYYIVYIHTHIEEPEEEDWKLLRRLCLYYFNFEPISDMRT